MSTDPRPAAAPIPSASLPSLPASMATTMDAPSAALAHLTQWVRDTLGDEVDIAANVPGNALPATRCVGLHLMQLRTPESNVGHKTPQLQLQARYLVTATAPNLAQAQDDLCQLAFAAMEMPDLQADFSPLPHELWLAWCAAPRPAFTLTVPLRKARAPQRKAPLVRVPLTITPVAIAPLRGQLLGPDDTPVADARIDILDMNRGTQTGNDGRFVIPGVPMDRNLTLRVRARGTTEQFRIPASTLAEGPLSLRMNLT